MGRAGPRRLVAAGIALAWAGLAAFGCGDEVAPTAPGVASSFAIDAGGPAAQIEMVWIEPGTFRMGSPATELARRADEGPAHEVTIRRGFWMAKYELTQAQWRSAIDMPRNPEHAFHDSPEHPAAYISWNDVQALLQALNATEGAPVYRMPTEAEWEYACRAGTQTPWHFGDDVRQIGDYAWYFLNAWEAWEKYVHAVGTRQPNAWGLYDMHGNALEWVQDRYAADWYGRSPRVDPQGPVTGDTRVLRGGHMATKAFTMRSANRFRADQTLRSQVVTARLVRQDP